MCVCICCHIIQFVRLIQARMEVYVCLYDGIGHEAYMVSVKVNLIRRNMLPTCLMQCGNMFRFLFFATIPSFLPLNKTNSSFTVPFLPPSDVFDLVFSLYLIENWAHIFNLTDQLRYNVVAHLRTKNINRGIIIKMWSSHDNVSNIANHKQCRRLFHPPRCV